MIPKQFFGVPLTHTHTHSPAEPHSGGLMMTGFFFCVRALSSAEKKTVKGNKSSLLFFYERTLVFRGLQLQLF